MKTEFEVYRATMFKEILEVLNTVTEEPVIQINPQGLYSIAMNPSHCFMYEFDLPDAFFDSWHVDQSEKLQVNLGYLLKALKKVTKKETLRFNYSYDKVTREKTMVNIAGHPTMNKTLVEEKKNEEIKLTLRSDYDRVKTIECLELVEEEMPSPKIYFKNKVRLTVDVFKRILEDFGGNSEHITLIGSGDSIQFKTDSDTYKDFVELDKDNDYVLELNNDETSRATYTINHILPFIKKAQKIAEVVTIKFSQDMPMMIDVELPMGKLIYYNAPCIGI